MDAIQLIEAKIAELQKEREKAQLHLGMIDHELEEQQTALRVLRRLMPDVVIATKAMPGGITALVDSNVLVEAGRPLLYKDMLLAILKAAYPRGLTAAEIRMGAMERFKENINPNTLTVSLGRHKEDGRVTIEGRRWRYVPSESEKQEAVSELFQ